MDLFNTDSFRVTQEGLDAVWLKQRVISNNLANADTPGFKASFVSFSGILEESAGANARKELHVRPVVTTDESTNMLDDESNVDVDQQNLEFARAQLQYDTLLSKMNSEFNMLRLAMK